MRTFVSTESPFWKLIGIYEPRRGWVGIFIGGCSWRFTKANKLVSNTEKHVNTNGYITCVSGLLP